MFAPIPTRKSSSAERVGFSPTPRMESREPGTSSAATRKNAAEERSDGTTSSRPVSVGRPASVIFRRLDREVGAELAQRDFGVVARAHRLGDGGLAFGEEAGEQHAGLHLRARHRQVVIDGPQLGAVDFERRKLVFARLDVRAHLRPAAS